MICRKTNPQRTKGICTFTARQNPSPIGGSGVSGTLGERIKAVHKLGERIRAEIEGLRQEQAELLILGPTSLAFIAWDIVDDQGQVLSMTEFGYITELLNVPPKRFPDAAPSGVATSRQLARERRQAQSRLSDSTTNLIAAVVVETEGYLSSNPEALDAFIEELNMRRGTN